MFSCRTNPIYKVSNYCICMYLFKTYTQTKKLRPIFMVLYLLIQLRCRNKNKTKMFIKRRTHKNW